MISLFSGDPPTCQYCGWAYKGKKRSAYFEVLHKPRSFGRIGNWFIGLSFVLLILCPSALGLYDWAESAGYVHHSRIIDVAMKTSWIAGEYKTCYKPVPYKMPSAGPALTPAPVPDVLTCDDAADVHALNVKFYGDADSIPTWNCQRVEDSEGNGILLTCKVK